MPNDLHIVYGFFPAKTAELSSCNWDHMVYEDKNIYYLAFYRKSLTTFAQIGKTEFPPLTQMDILRKEWETDVNNL